MDISGLYLQAVADHTVGPQAEGVLPEHVQDVVQDPRTEFLGSGADAHHSAKIPFIVPIEYATWINQDFLNDRGHKTGLMYCSLPQDFINQVNEVELGSSINRVLSRSENLKLLIDFPEDSTPFYQRLSIPYSTDTLLTADGTEAATYHYETTCSPNLDAIEEFEPNPNIRHLTQEELINHFPRLWDIYSRRFKDLVDDHPVSGAFNKEELLQILIADGSRVSAYFDTEGTIQAFGHLVDDLKLCPWLNQNYFQKLAQGKHILYMPAIATAPEAGVSVSTQIMNNMLYDTLNLYGEFVLTFECSNKSAQYIPKIVRRAFNQSGLVDYTDFAEKKHYYQIVSFNSQ